MQSGAFAPALPGQVDAAATALSEPNLKSWPVRMPVAVWPPQAREQFAPFWVRVRGIGADGLLASIFPAACEVEAGVSRHCCHVTLSELTDAQEDSVRQRQGGWRHSAHRCRSGHSWRPQRL